ncbi:3-deoxy-D-manno-octulosonic acid transferase [Spirosoma utsteinense]|uniref:3-deoxy-D-manno-octulosonic acid transferase n=1 Tax=Spirosoma utsteinense TaxID=2585773 RepID=A0ABR6W2K4_9BACT|nr:glycosyltransferase N-terminal domain-containing protein [Spirosoma utsteinense]MBC3784365.1 3-deoxy-D-manno-octulosonic-acid transferase [Spirosoma utsteinense]MBC3790836.1 3-deoxy-D-manno-octulosonic-acid transferase [Spirosoma utsteinense]
MFSGLYNTGLSAYKTLLHLAAPFNPKAKLWVAGRHNWVANLTQKLDGNTADIAWFHAASLGEFEQGRPVMEAYRAQYPEHKILLTFFSPSGYEVRKQYDGADYVLYLPVDSPANARQFVTLVNPKIAFFIKYEFWYNYLRELKAARVPVVSFSAIFRPNQLFFRPWGGFYRNLLAYFDHILVQNQESVQLLEEIGIRQVTLAGDTRFDRVMQVAAAKKEIPIAQAFKLGYDSQTSATVPYPVLVVGSAWQADMDILIPFINKFDKPLKVIIAPHEIHDDEIERWRTQLSDASVRYSAIRSPASTDLSLASIHTLFIDNVGMLSSLYQYGEFAYIGGAFGKGLHNILEAATFGVPLFFGPNYGKFQEAVDLVDEGAAFPLHNTAELLDVFLKQYTDREKASHTSRAYVQRNVGATGKVMEVVKQLRRKGSGE